MSLDGRIALVTGAGSGLGRAMARSIAEAGATVALHYRANRDAVETLAAKLETAGKRVCIVQADLSTEDGSSALRHAVEAALGPVDILVNNAGDWIDKPITELAVDEWDRMIDTDLRGPFLLTQAIAPGMAARGWGRVVNISSIASLRYVPGDAVDGIAKAGINMLTKSFAVELARQGVTVNAVAPGWSLPDDEPFPPRAEDYPQCADTPNGRPGHAREVAALVQFLLCEEAAHITGQVLPIDGGLSAVMAKAR